jgi:hypothetical protein
LAAVAFLKNLPVSPEDTQKIAHKNADALLRLTTPAFSHRPFAANQQLLANGPVVSGRI